MSDNPFNPPQQPGRPMVHKGSFTIGEVTGAAFDAFMRAPGAWLAGSLVYILGILVSYLMCLIPVLFVAPMLVHGFMNFALKGLTGTPSIDDITAAFEDPLKEIVGFWGYALIVMGLMLPGSAIFGVGALMAGIVGMDSAVGGLFIFGSMMAFMAYILILSVRIAPAQILIAVEKMGPLDALRTSWELTEGHALQYLGLAFLSGIIVIAGELMCLVGLFPAICIVIGMQVAAYAKLRNLPIKP